MWITLGMALVAAVTGRRRLLGLATLFSVGSCAVLVWALLAGDFSLEYVARTTSLSTPWPYRVAALWGGMDGSMLFYATLSMAIAWVGLRSRAEVRIGAGVGLALLLIAILFANPFTVLDIPAVDGEGLLAILQHPAMIYHPPVLYLGLVVLVVPFAVAMATAKTTDARVRRWLTVSWSLLAFGMAFGANWAYVELGWGGFWAWDPVENTALIPWLAVTVYLHTRQIEASKGSLRRTNLALAGLPFAFSVVGIYLTRSGVTGSIHSFAEDPTVGRVLLGAALVVTAAVVWRAVRSEPGETWGRLRPGRSLWLAINAVLVSLILVFVLAGTLYPAVSSVLGDRTVVVDPRFYVMTVLPLAVVVAGSLAVALRPRSWVVFGALVGIAALIALLVAGPSVGVVLLVPALASLALLVYAVWSAPRRLRAVYVGHAGMALLLVAIAGSSLGDDFSGPMRPGDSVDVAGHEVSLTTIETGEADRFIFVRAHVEIDRAHTLTPEIRAYEDQALPVAEPALRSTPVGDVIVAISLLFPDGETVAVSVFVRPLVWWVWPAAALIGLSGLLSLAGRDGAVSRRRRSATAMQQRGGTTTDRSAP